MRPCLPLPTIERARPLLGTIARARVEHVSEAAAHAAIDAAFAEVAEIHRLMSFHEAGSDLSRIHRAGAGAWVEIDPRTAAVLAFALRHAAASRGVFDPTMAPRAVARGALPRPSGAAWPDADATWRDVFVDGDRVWLARSAWLDLGGVAKGYAVDRAVDCLKRYGAQSGCVDAGGDLRVFGPAPEWVGLRVEGSPSAPVVEIADGAMASSGGGVGGSLHFNGPSRDPIDASRFACVTAPTCMCADALTKVVLAVGVDAASALLSANGAAAYAFDPSGGWWSSESAG
jgi:thiamine biosynthesis lipoprotein